MNHAHSHEYMHDHNIPHEHGHHGHDHEHEHEHAHCPSAGNCAGGCAGCNADPRMELIAMMKYMVNHNAAHAGELAELAKKVKDMGEAQAYEQIMLAVSDFEKGNMRLSTVLAAMNLPQ